MALARVWSWAVWTIGPWACGYLVVLAAAALRIILQAPHAPEQKLDFFLYGHYVVGARSHVIGVLVAAVVSAAAIALALSKRAATWP